MSNFDGTPEPVGRSRFRVDAEAVVACRKMSPLLTGFSITYAAFLPEAAYTVPPWKHAPANRTLYQWVPWGQKTETAPKLFCDTVLMLVRTESFGRHDVSTAIT